MESGQVLYHTGYNLGLESVQELKSDVLQPLTKNNMWNVEILFPQDLEEETSGIRKTKDWSEVETHD